MAKVGLITILYNSNDVLEGFIKSLSIQNYNDYHLYIWDNTPSDITDDVLKKLIQKYPLPSFSHIKSSENVGFARGNNILIEKGINDGCEYFLILNNDIEFEDKSLLKVMLETADKNAESLIIPKIYFHNTNKIWMAGGHLRIWKAMGVHIGEGQEDVGQFESYIHCDFAPMCFMLIKKEVFIKVGLLDEKFFVYFEDTDFLYRASTSNYKILYMPQLKVYHKVSSLTGGDESNFSIFYGSRNRIYFIRKHLKTLQKIVPFSFYFLSRLIKIGRYNTEKRKSLWKGIKEGFKLKTNPT